MGSCARSPTPETAVDAGTVPDEPELVIDEAPEDTAAPLVVNPGVTTESVPPLEVPDGFSSSFGDIPDIAEEPAAEPESTAPAAPSSTRISSRKNAGALFDQLTDDCPPEAVAEQADIGALTGAQLACAEVAIGQATTAPELRNELSLALIANAQALRDPSWVGLVERHLTDIDPTNPSLALRLARIRHDEGRMAEALRWSEVALTHRADWPPGVYEPRTLLAHQLYTSSAQSVWHELRSTKANRADVEDARVRLVEAAEAWLSYERHIGRRGTIAIQVCRTAGGDCR